jgi:subtilisin family serine protease
MFDYCDCLETGNVIVAVNNNFTLSDSPVSYADILSRVNYEKAEVIFHSKKNGSNIGDILLVHLTHKDKPAVMNAVQELSANPRVAFAESDYLYNAHIVPNDPYYRYLWGLESINAPLAWNYTTGGADVVVGVVDSGIDHNHPDIRDNMWISQNGQYINGWNFLCDNSNSMDTTGHGTHIAGTIGAVGNNFIGITGVRWKGKIAALKIGNAFMNLAAIIASIDFANRNNIPILNNSWGCKNYSHGLRLAIEQYDGLFVVSSGNCGLNNDIFPDYPSSYDSDNIISVAASCPDNNLTDFSNYGAESVDIAAPGIDILSLSLYGGYSYETGTSMAAPHVTGAAALLKSYMPDLTALDIKNIILSSAAKYPALRGKISSGGILNVNSMLEMANRFSKAFDRTG